MKKLRPRGVKGFHQDFTAKDWEKEKLESSLV